jgi:hypothetical protein
MTILDKAMGASPEKNEATRQKKPTSNENPSESSDTELLTQVESQFKHMMAEFQANTGFSVNTGEQPVDTMIELLSGKGVAVSIAVLLSYIRYCVNRGLKKEITLKIGYNKPAAVPMNFAVNEELLEEIYPGDVVEIN